MKALKVKFRHLDTSFGYPIVKLSKRLSQTVAKHGYKYIQINGKVYPVNCRYLMPKEKGYIPFVSVVGTAAVEAWENYIDNYDRKQF